jgi:hypothetical protein
MRLAHSVAEELRQAPAVPYCEPQASMLFLEAHCRAKARMVCAGMSQIGAAHSGVLGTPSTSPRMYAFHSSK